MSEAAAKSEEGVDAESTLFVFEDVIVEKAFLSVLGASGLDLSKFAEFGQDDEVEITLRGAAQEARIKTKNRGRRDGGRKQTIVTRVIKVDELTAVKVRPKLVK